jgi:hypothetical protein
MNQFRNPEELLKISKKGKSLMIFVRVIIFNSDLSINDVTPDSLTPQVKLIILYIYSILEVVQMSGETNLLIFLKTV